MRMTQVPSCDKRVSVKMVKSPNITEAATQPRISRTYLVSESTFSSGATWQTLDKKKKEKEKKRGGHEVKSK